MTKSELNNAIKIAVLPFQVLGGDESLKPLMIGFIDDLITDFSKFVGLSVISQYSTAKIKDSTDPKKLDTLGANFLVTGSVRQHQDKLRITIKLIRSDDMTVVFAGKHNVLYSELLDVQDTIIQQIVGVLQGEINYNLLSHSYRKKSVNLKSYENWLLGMELLKKGTVESDEEARIYFQAAIDNDPQCAMAYAGMSLTYFNEWSCQLWERWDINKKGAHEYALKALALDENDYTALGVLGRTYLYQEEYEKAEHYSRKALRMNPNDANNIILVAYNLTYLGYPKEALGLYEKFLELNPLRRENYLIYGVFLNFECGNFEVAKELNHKIAIEASWIDYPVFVAANYYQLGEMEPMWKCWQVFLDLYEKRVFSGKGQMELAALNWHMEINPYAKSSYTKHFWDFIREHYGGTKKTQTTPQLKKNNTFQFRNGLWEICFEGQEVILADAKGLHDLHKMLSEPHKGFNCLDLMGAAVDEQHHTSTIDQKAKQDYMARIKELQSAIEEAEVNNMNIELDALHTEYDTLLDHLSTAVGIKGKSRSISSTIEKARSAVTWRIRAAIKKIENAHPELANYLSTTIKTGTNCLYKPDNQVDWKL